MASVAANIAKGMSRRGGKDKKRMLNIAYSSAIEVLNLLPLCLDLELIPEEDYNNLRKKNRTYYKSNSRSKCKLKGVII